MPRDEFNPEARECQITLQESSFVSRIFFRMRWPRLPLFLPLYRYDDRAIIPGVYGAAFLSLVLPAPMGCAQEHMEAVP